MTGHVEDQRLAALQKEWQEHPVRFGQQRVPKKPQLPTAAWINEPVKQEESEEMLAG